jgi:hypothetical protein
MARRAKPARSRPDPIVTSGRKVAPVKANNGEALGTVAAGVVGELACWVQILDAPIDLRLLEKRRCGSTRGRHLDEASILPSHRWSYPLAGAL